MILVIATFLVSIIEAWINKVYEEVGKDPHNWMTFTRRLVLYLALSFIAPGGLINLFAAPLMAWWFFDFAMATFMGKKPWYLGSHPVDQFQKNSFLGNLGWFFIKFFLMAIGVSLVW